MNRLPIAFLVASALLAAGPARAREAGDGFHNHQGFFLRLTPGLTLGGSGLDDLNGQHWGVSGGGMSMDFEIGGALARNFILCFEFGNMTAVNPTVERPDFHGTAEDTSWSVQHFGVGASLYFGPNLYVHGGLEALWMQSYAYDWGVEYETRSATGAGLKLALGKEWWASANWGLGLALQALLGSVPDVDNSWGVATFGLAFSATYN